MKKQLMLLFLFTSYLSMHSQTDKKSSEFYKTFSKHLDSIVNLSFMNKYIFFCMPNGIDREDICGQANVNNFENLTFSFEIVTGDQISAGKLTCIEEGNNKKFYSVLFYDAWDCSLPEMKNNMSENKFKSIFKDIIKFKKGEWYFLTFDNLIIEAQFMYYLEDKINVLDKIKISLNCN